MSQGASRLHFGAQRGMAFDTPSYDSADQELGTQDLIDLGIPRTSSRKEEDGEKSRRLQKEIRDRELELEELNAARDVGGKPKEQTSQGFTTEQVRDIIQLMQSFQISGSFATNQGAHEQRLSEIAPRFDLNDPRASWEAFSVFFDVNRVSNEEVQFNILNSRLPRETMHNFGKENPGCGGHLNKLKDFLMAYSKESSPCMNYCNSYGKYGQGALLRNVFHEAKLMADLPRDERIKLNAFYLSSGSNKNIIQNNLHVPLENFVFKIKQKWNMESRSVPSQVRYPVPHTPPRFNRNSQQSTPTRPNPDSKQSTPRSSYREYKTSKILFE